MIITLSGMPGAGKTTVGKEVAKRLRLKYISIGERIREHARAQGKDILELMKDRVAFAAIQRDVERHIDTLAERDHVLIDGRDAFYHLRKSFKVFLSVDTDTAAQRIYDAARDTEHFTNAGEARKSLEQRKIREQELYQKLHNIDIYNPIHYDLVIDTTHLTIQEIVDQIVETAR